MWNATTKTVTNLAIQYLNHMIRMGLAPEGAKVAIQRGSERQKVSWHVTIVANGVASIAPGIRLDEAFTSKQAHEQLAAVVRMLDFLRATDLIKTAF